RIVPIINIVNKKTARTISLRPSSSSQSKLKRRNTYLIRGHSVMMSVVLIDVKRVSFLIFFFFQAEDDIRYRTVTGVQSCALPIWRQLCRKNRRAHAARGNSRIGVERVGGVRGGCGANCRAQRGLDDFFGIVVAHGLVNKSRQIGRASCRGRGYRGVVARVVGRECL